MRKISILMGIVLAVLLVFGFTGCEWFQGPEGPEGPAGPEGPEGPEGPSAFDLPPDASAGLLNLDILAVGHDILGRNTYPTITSFLSLKDSYGYYIPGVGFPSTFFDAVAEDDGSGEVAQGPLTVVELEPVIEGTVVDYLFVFDTTGSMGGAVDAMKANIVDFVDSLEGSGLDWKVGFITFGDNYGETDTVRSGYESWVSDTEQPRPYLGFTDDAETIETFVNDIVLEVGDDGLENQIDAMMWGAYPYSGSGLYYTPEYYSFYYRTSTWFRTGARIVILITDVDFHTPDDSNESDGDISDVIAWYPDGGAYSAAVYNYYTDLIYLFQYYGIKAVVVSPAYDEYLEIAEETDGVWFDFWGDFASIIPELGPALAANYLVAYESEDMPLSTEIDVRIAAHAEDYDGDNEIGEDIASYTTPSSVPYSSISAADLASEVFTRRGLVINPNPSRPANE